jgi:sugar phosphate isomerase/epimerase
VALLERQWDEAISLWEDLGRRAVSHGVAKLAFELHPLHLVYNVPTLRRMRDAVGPVIGANMDPSHLFWQRMDPLAVIADLGEAVYHVHLKDTEIIADQVALAGVLDTRPFDDPEKRGWIFRAVGSVRDAAWWSSFIAALRAVGYDDVLSIENEDVTLPAEQAVRNTAAFMRPLLG